jgi:hypothetical protein
MGENVIEGRYHPRSGKQEEDWELFLDGKKLDPKRSLGVLNHSPDGFAYGYGGSAPAQAALAIMLEATNDEDLAVRLHHSLAADVLARQPMHGDFTATLDLARWVAEQEREVPAP